MLNDVNISQEQRRVMSQMMSGYKDSYRKAVQLKDKSVLEMESRLLDLLANNEAGVTSSTLIELVPYHTFPMQAAIWKLTTEGVIEMSEDRIVRIKEVKW